jgi:hypothetical protein
VQPQLIEQHLLVRRTPERPDLLGLAPGCKGLLVHTQGKKLLEMLGFGITLADLPPSNRVAGDLKPLSQSGLGQPDRHAQRQHELTEGIIALTIGGSLHGPSPFRMSQRSKAMPSDDK